MSFLDDLTSLHTVDRSNMAEELRLLPARVREAVEAPFPSIGIDGRALTTIAVIGLGGSAIGGDLAAAMVAHQCPLPIIVLRSSVLPDWVQPSTLVIAVSYSGNTAETVKAYLQAKARGCPLVAIASGGKLAAHAAADGTLLLSPGSYPQPRLAVGAITVLILKVISIITGTACDAMCNAMSDAFLKITSSVTQEVPTEQNPAKLLAYQLLDRLSLVVAGGLLAPAARRWKTQMNENAKSLCVIEEVPELFHNTLEGLKLPSVVSDLGTWVFLEAPSDQTVSMPQLDHFAALLKESGLRVERVRAPMNKPHEALWWIIGMGDWVSYYCACLNNVDPMPVSTIQGFKKNVTAP